MSMTISISEANAGNQLQEDRFELHFTLPTLQELTSFQIVRSIWFNYVSRSKRTDSEERNDCDLLTDAFGISADYDEDTKKMVESLETPRSIEKMLKLTLDSMHYKMEDWIEFFQEYTFSKNLRKNCIRRFDADWCVWSPIGFIDSKKSAVKMLSYASLSNVQKFAIMCEFCMEDELRSFQLGSLPKSFIKRVTFSRHYLLYYWICYLKNKLYKIPLEIFNSVDLVMAATCENERWIAFEYFWNRLGRNDQISIAVFRFQEDNKLYSCQKKLLDMMSWDQQRCVLSQTCDHMIANFLIHLESPECASWIWKHSKDLMSVEQFAYGVNRIFCSRVPLYFEENMLVLMEIWNTACDEQRNYFAETMSDEIIESLSCCKTPSPTAVKLVCEVLSLKSAAYQKSVFLEKKYEFDLSEQSISDPGSIEELINLCLPSPADRLEYKKVLANSAGLKYHCQTLFNDEDFENLNQQIDIYWPHADAAREYKKTLLEWIEIDEWCFIHHRKAWNALSKYIDEIFADDAESAMKWKKEFISTYANNFDVHWYNANDTPDEMVQVVESMFAGAEEELKTVRKYFLESFAEVLVDVKNWRNLEENYLYTFVSWCLGNDEKAIVEFKNDFSVDLSIRVVFNTIFDELNEIYTKGSREFSEELLLAFDKCMKWVSVNIDEIKEFKLSEVNEFRKIAIFNEILKRNDNSSLEILLRWFYDGDEEKVRNFRSKKVKLERGNVECY